MGKRVGHHLGYGVNGRGGYEVAPHRKRSGARAQKGHGKMDIDEALAVVLDYDPGTAEWLAEMIQDPFAYSDTNRLAEALEVVSAGISEALESGE